MMNSPLLISSVNVAGLVSRNPDLQEHFREANKTIIVPAYTMAPHSESLKLMRVVVREDFSKSRCDALIQDFKYAIEALDKMDKHKVEMNKEHMAQQAINKWRKLSVIGGPNEHFKEQDDHSLQGKHGKTHAVC